MNEWNKEYDIAGRTLIGGRLEQQDRFGLFFPDLHTLGAIVCDGMGGTEAGSMASETAVLAFAREIRQINKEDPYQNLYELLDIMDYEVCMQRKEKKLSAGTTSVCIYIYENKLYWCSVGDSRLYIRRNGAMICATRDHNYLMRLNQMRKRGEITREEYLQQKNRGHELISYIGMGGLLQRDVSEAAFELRSRDMLLACSDGVYKEISDERICDILGQYPDAESVADLMEQELENRKSAASDNATFIIIKKK